MRGIRAAVFLLATVSLTLAPASGAAPLVRPSATAAAPSAPAPVQLLGLTDEDGTATQIATEGLSSTQAAAVQDEQARTASCSPGGTSLCPASVNRLSRLAAAAPGTGEEPVDPQKDATLLTQPLEVDSFLVAGFAWEAGGSLPEDVRVYLRVREKGVWSSWFLNEVEDATGPEGRPALGTSELVTAGADAVQASVVLKSVAHLSSLPKGLHLVLVPGVPKGEKERGAEDLNAVAAHPTPVAPTEEPKEEPQAGPDSAPAPEEADAQAAPGPAGTTGPRTSAAGVLGGASTGSATALSQAVAGASGIPVPVASRADWHADESSMTWDPEYATARHVVIHHTAGSNSYTADQSASIVRGIYHYHAVTLGWGDIGYNLLVDKYGQVFEGRYGTLASAAGKMVVGGHARGVNTGTMGISMIGDYSSTEPTDIQLSRVGDLAGWFLQRAGVHDAQGSSGLTFRTTERYQAGQTVSLPTVLAHRDVGYTACPGERAYARMGQIRQIAQNRISGRASAGSARTTGAAGSWELWDGQWYFHNADGTWAKGWLDRGGRWFYLDPDSGVMRTGWVRDGHRWFYLSPDDGRMVTGWLDRGGRWFYLDPDSGVMRTGWVRDGHRWFYLSPDDGRMVTGWLDRGGRWFYLDPDSGVMRTGWVRDGHRWFYLSPDDGRMLTGWLQHAGSWYWLAPGRGDMATDAALTEGQWSRFSQAGAWLGYTSAPAARQEPAATASYHGSVLQADSNGLHKVMAAPSASKQELVGKMTAAYAARGLSYPAYALAPAGAASPTELFTIVYEEAVAEGVSPELLFAQVVKETGWLRFGGDVSIYQNNFGGIGAVGGGARGHSFPDVRTGLRAQAQHLRAYGDPTATVSGLAHQVVDPRFVYVRKGGAQYVEHLGIQENPARTGWAAARGYGYDLVTLIRTCFA